MILFLTCQQQVSKLQIIAYVLDPIIIMGQELTLCFVTIPTSIYQCPHYFSKQIEISFYFCVVISNLQNLFTCFTFNYHTIQQSAMIDSHLPEDREFYHMMVSCRKTSSSHGIASFIFRLHHERCYRKKMAPYASVTT